MKNIKFKSGLIFGIFVLLLMTSIVPSSIGQTHASTQQQNITKTSLPSTEKTSSFTLYVIGKNGLEKQEKILSASNTLKIYEKYQELKKEMTSNPYSDKTQRVKQEFFDLLEENHALPTGMSKDQLISLTQPPVIPPTHLRTGIQPFPNKASEWFCNFATFGEGSAFPIIILPRLIPFLLTPIPRAFVWWSTPSGITSVGGLISRTGFLAGGQQKGIALGFWGIGFSIFLPPIMSYGIFGYAVFTRVTAEEFQFYPPNNPPEISQTDPVDGQQMIPLSTANLRFEINDEDGDLMSYNVTTYPDIGSGSGGLKSNGVYSISISGLESLTQYTWRIQVTDGKDAIEKTMTFMTENVAPLISNPSPADGERQVPSDLAVLKFTIMDFQGDAMDYTVETSPNVGSAHVNGVHDGTYTVPVSGLAQDTAYRWFVNVTDGAHPVSKTFSFVTGFPAQFNPFEYGWLYRKQITIDHTNVAGDVENFPVLLSIVDADLSQKARENGEDILFMHSAGVSTRFNYEIESFNHETGALIAWVNLTHVSSNEDTTFYMYYGNPTCLPQQYPEKTWDANFWGVWHLKESYETRYDSTSNGKDCTTSGTTHTTSAKIDGGEVYDARTDSISTYSNTDSMSKFTLECWVAFSTDEADPSTGGDVFMSIHKNDPSVFRYHDEKYYVYADGTQKIESIDTFRDTNWHYVSLVATGSQLILYVDNVVEGNVPWSGTSSNAYPFYIGDNRIGTDYFYGTIDEVRISNSDRDMNWIKTSYENQINPAGFIFLGPEEPSP
ncbi:MAG: DUF2341 domain-containing protein [Thermoplasmata archaeon]|nr:DUF2341 domain-containing protein [Thermoplasmata archaeon]MBE3139693.1 DUF2341 domain-containing protein [Thermoplasmata archaeon]